MIEASVEGGAAAVMTTFGVSKRYRERLEGASSLYREDWLAYTEWNLLHAVEDALLIGADGVVLMEQFAEVDFSESPYYSQPVRLNPR